MYYVILLSEDICEGIPKDRYNISIKDACVELDKAKDSLGKLYKKLQQNEIFNVTNFDGNSFHLENLDINKYSYFGTIVEFSETNITKINNHL